MRIIAGRFKGRHLATPRWTGLRPTSDKLRETLFNILAPRIAGARVLDAYAGTGALGIEAISRGAAHVTFVDRDRRALGLLAENLSRCGVEQGYVMIRGDVGGVARDRVSAKFDLILVDPPYEQGEPAAILATLGECVAPGGLLVLEHARRRSPPDSAGSLVRSRLVVSGDSALAFYQRADGRTDH